MYLDVLRVWTGTDHKLLVGFNLVNFLTKFQRYKRFVLIMLPVECIDVPKVDAAVFKQRDYIF